MTSLCFVQLRLRHHHVGAVHGRETLPGRAPGANWAPRHIGGAAAHFCVRCARGLCGAGTAMLGSVTSQQVSSGYCASCSRTCSQCGLSGRFQLSTSCNGRIRILAEIDTKWHTTCQVQQAQNNIMFSVCMRCRPDFEEILSTLLALRKALPESTEALRVRVMTVAFRLPLNGTCCSSPCALPSASVYKLKRSHDTKAWFES